MADMRETSTGRVTKIGNGLDPIPAPSFSHANERRGLGTEATPMPSNAAESFHLSEQMMAPPFIPLRREEESSLSGDSHRPFTVLPRNHLDGIGMPQQYQADPNAYLPIDSECLVGVNNPIKSILSELEPFIEEELREVTKLQRQSDSWKEKIKKNRSVIDKNLSQIKQNRVDMSYDIKNRDFWFGRAQQVLADYATAEASGSSSDWAWLIRKYGLKNPDGTSIEARSSSVGTLCNDSANSLALEYKAAGMRYDQTQRHIEATNALIEGDNDKLEATNQQLQKYIANVYANEIEPLQDGVLLLNELRVKLKSLERQETPPKYGDLRAWAEDFIDSFLKENPFTLQRVVNTFRRLASIPLPPINS